MQSESRPVAIVTGGAQGIGRGISECLLAEGYAVLIADVDAEAGQETADALGKGSACVFAPTDVSSEADAARCVAQAVSAFGRLDVVINNAGISTPSRFHTEELPLQEWDRVIATNLTGAFLMAKHATPHLRATHGAIVNIASTRALQSEPNTLAYSASKGGLVALTHSLAISLGPEIRVNCVSPGWIDVSGWRKSSRRRPAQLSREDHAQHPVGRVGRPEDIAGLVRFLVSEASGFITGQNFIADGGITKRMIYVE